MDGWIEERRAKRFRAELVVAVICGVIFHVSGAV